MSRKPKIRPKELVKKGGRLYGGIYRLNGGGEIYLAFRKDREIFRSGKRTISEAVREGVACWAIDHDTLTQMRLRGITIVGIYLEEFDELWLTKLETFLNAKFLNYEHRGGALQRYLPLGAFRKRVGISLAKR